MMAHMTIANVKVDSLLTIPNSIRNIRSVSWFRVYTSKSEELSWMYNRRVYQCSLLDLDCSLEAVITIGVGSNVQEKVVYGPVKHKNNNLDKIMQKAIPIKIQEESEQYREVTLKLLPQTLRISHQESFYDLTKEHLECCRVGDTRCTLQCDSILHRLLTWKLLKITSKTLGANPAVIHFLTYKDFQQVLYFINRVKCNQPTQIIENPPQTRAKTVKPSIMSTEANGGSRNSFRETNWDKNMKGSYLTGKLPLNSKLESDYPNSTLLDGQYFNEIENLLGDNSEEKLELNDSFQKFFNGKGNDEVSVNRMAAIKKRKDVENHQKKALNQLQQQVTALYKENKSLQCANEAQRKQIAEMRESKNQAQLQLKMQLECELIALRNQVASLQRGAVDIRPLSPFPQMEPSRYTLGKIRSETELNYLKK